MSDISYHDRQALIRIIEGKLFSVMRSLVAKKRIYKLAEEILEIFHPDTTRPE